MKKTLLIQSILLFFFLVFPLLADHSSSCEDGEHLAKVILARNASSTFDIPWTLIFGSEVEITEPVSIGQAYHGNLVQAGDVLRYTAADSFWEVGSDSFHVAHPSLSGSYDRVAVALVVGEAHHGEPVVNTFDTIPEGWSLQHVDTQDNAGDWELVVPLSIDNSAAFAAYTLPDSGHDEILSLPHGPPVNACFFFFDQGGTGHGSGGDIRCGDICGEAALPLQGLVASQTIMTMIDRHENDVARVVLKADDRGWWAQLQAFDELGGGPYETDWTAVSHLEEFTFRVELDLLPPPGVGNDTARLYINDREVLSTPAFEAGDEERVSAYRFGAMNRVNQGIGLRMDDLELTRYSVHARDEPLHTDSFDGVEFDHEHWNVDASSGLYLASPLELDPTADHGRIEAHLAQISPASWLFDKMPAAADRAVVRFDVDPSSLVVGDHVLILGGLDANAVSGAAEFLRVWVTVFESGPWLRATINQGTSTTHTTPNMALDNATNRVEVVFDMTADEGSISVWVNGQKLGVLAGLASLDRALDSLRFGAMGAGDETSVLGLDEYQLWVDHPPIGCDLPCDPTCAEESCDSP